jgi:hypothetical protein
MLLHVEYRIIEVIYTIYIIVRWQFQVRTRTPASPSKHHQKAIAIIKKNYEKKRTWVYESMGNTNYIH